MADITQLEQDLANDERVADIPIYQKNGAQYTAADGTPSTIGVTGSDAKRYRAEKHAIQREMLAQRRSRLEPEDITRNRIRQASAAVSRWHGWESAGKPLDCTTPNARALLKIEHILEQVEAGIDGHGSFFVNNSPS